jgi:GNAT superfamily N-acetyltransferase
MLESQSPINLSTGEQVEVAVITCPDLMWAERVEKLLAHKGEPWNWQNSQFLREDVGFETRFYLLHRDGVPFANTLLSESACVGIVNHVWTNPEDRQKGASKSLMQIVIEDFKRRKGEMLVLQAGYGEVAYHMYKKFGFESIEPESGYMDWYANDKKQFIQKYFAVGEAQLQPLQWKHWLSIQPLLQSEDDCITRLVALKHIGRRTTEGPFLSLLQDEFTRRANGEEPRAYVLETTTTAVAGFALWSWHPLWLDTCLVDVYCHSGYWDKAKELLDVLELPSADRYLAYADCEAKKKVLLAKDFKESAVFKNRVATPWTKKAFSNVAMFEKA